MNCKYWKDVVAQLRDVSSCHGASHALASGLPEHSNLEVPKLFSQALECVPENEIIEGTIYAYRNWDAQPYCDLILAQFASDQIFSVYRKLDAPEAKMKVGVLGVLEEMDRELARQLASSLNNPGESEDVLSAVRYSLRAT